MSVRNFNIGDLIINNLPVELSFDGYIIQEGAIGLVVALMPYKEWETHEYDYVILIQGREVFFFDHEITLYNSKQDIK